MQEVTSSAMEHSASGGTDSVGDKAGASHSVPTSASRRLMISFTPLSVLGVAVTIELTRIHVFVYTDPSYHSVCAMSEGVNCETAAVSPYSVFAGLPVSVWGRAGYLVMGGLALWSLGKRRLHPRWPLGLLLVLTAFSAAASAVLAFISATRINSLGLFDMGSYAINAGLLFVCLVTWRQTRARVVEVGGVRLVADFDDQGFEIVSRVHRAEGREHPRTAAIVSVAMEEQVAAGFRCAARTNGYQHDVVVLQKQAAQGEHRQP